MKRIIFSSALLILLVGITSLAPAAKHKYTSDEANCSIIFPTEYSLEEKEKEDYRTLQAQAIDNEMIFMAICTIHNVELSDTDALADVSFEAFMGGLGGTPTGKSTWKVKKHNGLKSEFAVAGENLMGEYRVIIRGQIQYQVVAVAPESAWNAKKAQSFFKSFKLTN